MDDTVLPVGTPEGVTFQLHPAGPLPRLLAVLIDMAIVGVVQVAALLVLFLLHVFAYWIMTLLSFVLLTFGMVACELWWNGASPGKRVFRLRVVMADGRPVTFQASLLRNTIRFVDQMLLLGFFVPLATRGFRRLGDLVGGTLVVYRHGAVVPWKAAAVDPLAPQRPVDPETAAAAVEFSRRWDEFGAGLRRELAAEAGDLFRREPGDQPENTLRSVGQWYREKS
jgi:uncharacterized RDD family membrane protein YckC